MKINSIVINLIALLFTSLGFVNSTDLIKEIATNQIKEQLTAKLNKLDKTNKELLAKKEVLKNEESLIVKEINKTNDPSNVKLKFPNQVIDIVELDERSDLSARYIVSRLVPNEVPRFASNKPSQYTYETTLSTVLTEAKENKDKDIFNIPTDSFRDLGYDMSNYKLLGKVKPKPNSETPDNVYQIFTIKKSNDEITHITSQISNNTDLIDNITKQSNKPRYELWLENRTSFECFLFLLFFVGIWIFKTFWSKHIEKISEADAPMWDGYLPHIKSFLKKIKTLNQNYARKIWKNLKN